MKSLAIFGTGGLGRETLFWIKDKDYERVVFVVDDEYFQSREVAGKEVFRRSEISVEDFEWVLAVSDGKARKKIVEKLGPSARYASLIHPTAMVGETNEIGEGTIIRANVTITCDVKIGKHGYFGPGVAVGHDSVLGDYVSISPRVFISGNCKIGDEVSIGVGALIREKIEIAPGTVVGMGAVVVKDLSGGIYVGNPARLLR